MRGSSGAQLDGSSTMTNAPVALAAAGPVSEAVCVADAVGVCCWDGGC